MVFVIGKLDKDYMKFEGQVLEENEYGIFFRRRGTKKGAWFYKSVVKFRRNEK